jgi:hypothetical protein
LHAAHRRISLVVPVKSPLIRGAICSFAVAVSPEKKCWLTLWPVRWLNALLTPLFSAIGRARTHAAHCALLGSLAPGGRVEEGRGTGGLAVLGRGGVVGRSSVVGRGGGARRDRRARAGAARHQGTAHRQGHQGGKPPHPSRHSMCIFIHIWGDMMTLRAV